MDIRHLRYLLAIEEQRSFAAAARKLGISQQALGQSVTALEAELGLKLFERGSGTEPTVYGRALLKHATVVDTEMRRALGGLQQLKEAAAGEVHVGVGECFAGNLAARAIGSMHARNPAVKLHVSEEYTLPLLERLERGALDFVVGAPATVVPERPGLVQHVLGETQDVVFARASHPLARRRNVAVSDLQGYTWLLPTALGQVYEILLETFVDEGVPPPARIIWCDGTATGTGLLLHHDYLILVAPGMVAALHEPGLIVQLNVERPRRRRRMALWTRQNAALSPAAEALVGDFRLAAQLPAATRASKRRSRSV